MSARGRPLRFLAVVVGGWIAARAYVLWPDAVAHLPPPLQRIAIRTPAPRTPPRAMPQRLAKRASRPMHAEAAPPATTRALADPAAPAPAPLLPATRFAVPAAARPGETPPSPGYVLALLGLVRYGAAEPPAEVPHAGHWSVSAWAIARGGAQRSSVATPQLGGSQAGVRVAYALTDRVALAGRAAAALGTRQSDAAIGVEWRPLAAPVRLVAEQRIAIDRARGGASLGVVGGVSEVPLAAGFRLDGYGQAGVIARDGGEGYADGAIRAGRVVAGDGRGVTLDLGLGAWGAAQRGATRLDAGPSVAAVLPLGRRRVRVSLDWRQRLAGNARPASGRAVSIGSDF